MLVKNFVPGVGCELHPAATGPGTGAAQGLPTEGLMICDITAVLASSHSPRARCQCPGMLPHGNWDHKATTARMDENWDFFFFFLNESLSK